ncbi:hypothetical protein CC86DRAFT_357779 [Ophiobolus disseminans]|uniref:Zn(2)-C6 fungal-type domain-containing protein n=1 Tax=Ophiobolus disseminans TaxID=1469910 RepID=A0A6A6ZNN9_9PLEO|nr:hypothetical protein CC86DRAFT_357779 [Ophiobolus disseminans]
MVYRGRPSTGCRRCRERKILCDERQESCLRCGDRGITCPGYDRTVDAFFHDETANVRAKARKSKAKAIAARDARDAQERGHATFKTHGLPRKNLVAPLKEQGINFFMANYTSGLDQPLVTSPAYHQHVSTHGIHPLVATTMTALGIAGLSNQYKDPYLKGHATRCYVDAIAMANTAISSPDEVRNDTTLLAVNILSMFEATFNDSSLSGWSSHVEGAALLVRLRGLDQFSTCAGRRMYLHTIGLLATNCMGSNIPMPAYIQELNRQVVQYLDLEDLRHAFFFLHIKTNDLRARILDQPVVDLQGTIDEVLELDAMAVSILSDTNTAWQYDIVSCSGVEPGVYGDYYHVYPSHAVAQTWEWARYNRIYFHDIIRNCILHGFATSPPILVGQEYVDLLERSARLLLQMQSDIIASMPQFFHDIPNSFSNKCYGNHVSNDAAEERLPIIRITGGYTTLWSLYVAGSMSTATPSSQDFVLQCLERVGRQYGINHAKVLAHALRRKRKMDSTEEMAFTICPQYLPVVYG